MAADLADRWIDAILSERPHVLLHADSAGPLGAEEMAHNVGSRATACAAATTPPLQHSG